MEKEEEYSSLLEPIERQAFRIQIPYGLRLAIIWTLFFSIVGIVIQISQAEEFAFADSLSYFFGQGYFEWLKSIGSFVTVQDYASGMDVFTSMVSHWYYFLYTGGILALIWGIISWLINIEIVFKKRKKEAEQQVTFAKARAPVQRKTTGPDMGEWINHGLLLLSQNKIQDAEYIYHQIKMNYNSRKDSDHAIYKRILDFYYAIMEKKGKK